jgi:hypothetical protein
VWNGNAEYVEHYLYHLLGDPSMQMWAAEPFHFEPQKINLSYREIAHVNPGDPVFQVFGTLPGSGKRNPRGTVATLFSGNQVIGRGIVGRGGKLTITPETNAQPKNLHVSFDQQGFLPGSDTVDQAPQGTPTNMTIKCPTNVASPGTKSTTGKLTSVPTGTVVFLHYDGPGNQSADDTARTAANGNWTDRQALTSGQWQITATYNGDANFQGSSAKCSVTVG